MTFRLYRRALVAALLTSASMAAAQEEPRYEPAPDWVEESALPADSADDTNLLLLLDNQIKVEPGRQIEFIDTAYHVVTAEMLSGLGSIKVEWQPEVQDAVIHSIDIIRGDQIIDALDGGSHLEILRRETQLDQLSINGILTATMQLDGLQIGDIVRLRYSLISSDPALGGKAAGIENLPVAPLAIGHYNFRLLWDKGEPLKWVAADDAAIEETSGSGFREIRFEGVLPKRKDQPENAPARFIRAPTINYSTFGSWEHVSRSVAKLYDDRAVLEPGGPLAERVAQIAAQNSSPMARMTAAVELVQGEVRYLYKGMDFGNYTPQSPAETWEKRYGDCKAKTLLLMTLLRELGIEAEPVLVNSENGDVVADLLPGLYAFDHVVVRAKVGGTDYWLDGTMQGTSADNIGDVGNFSTGLPLTAAGSALIDVPVRPLSRPVTTVARTIDVSAGIGLPALVDMTMTFTGDIVPQIKAAQSRLDKESFDSKLDEIISSAGNDVTPLERSLSFSDDGRSAIISSHAIETFYWRWEDRRYQTSISPPVEEFSFDANRSRPAWKGVPVKVAHPAYEVTKLTIILPDMGAPFVLKGRPEFDETIAGVQFHHAVKIDGNRLVGDMFSRTAATEVPAADLPKIRTELARINANDLRLMVPGSVESQVLARRQAARKGRADKFRAIYADAITEAEPDDLGPYRNRAAFLAGIGDYRGAAADIEQILEREPSVEDYIWHSSLIEIPDPEGALRSVEQARELEPASSSAMYQMAKILWLHDRSDEMLAAVDEFESLGVEEEDVAIVRATALAQTGRKDEAVALLDAAFEKKPGNAQLYRARCSLKAENGIQLESALKDCTRATELSEDSYSALEDRGLAYWRMDRKESAIEDWQSALLSNPDAPHARYFLGMAEGGVTGAAKMDEAKLLDDQLESELKNWGMAG